MAQDDLLQNIRTYISTNITTPGTYLYRRPSEIDSITVIPITQRPANVRMWSQETAISVHVYIKSSPQSSYQKAMDIRDLLLAKKGTLVTNGVRFLSFYADAVLPQVVDVAEDDNEIYGFTFRVKYIDNTIPT